MKTAEKERMEKKKFQKNGGIRRFIVKRQSPNRKKENTQRDEYGGKYDNKRNETSWKKNKNKWRNRKLNKQKELNRCNK